MSTRHAHAASWWGMRAAAAAAALGERTHTPVRLLCLWEAPERSEVVCVWGGVACGLVQPAASGTTALHRALKALDEAVLPAAKATARSGLARRSAGPSWRSVSSP